MNDAYCPPQADRQPGCSRRRFLGGAVSAAAAAPLLGAATASPLVGAAAGFAASQPALEAKPDAPKRKIKLGLVGCGRRGGWIAKLFQQHGGYEFHAVADYFQRNADRLGEGLGVDQSRRFSGLSGYKKVLESGVEAVALIVPPYFLAEQCAAAAAAGLHVYMAKPVAIDVFGCRRVAAAGKLATGKRRAFLVDYQIPTDPVNIQVAELIRKEELGKLAKIVTSGIDGDRPDPPKTANIENRLERGVWDNDMTIGGSFIVSFDIHAIDAAVWVVGRPPVAAMGSSRIYRANPHGDSHDVCGVIYEYADGLIHEHSGMALPNAADDGLICKVFSRTAHAVVAYAGKAHFHRRQKNPAVDASVVNLYEAGAVRNIAAFYQDVTAGRCENLTVRRAVDGCLTCILGREAALRHGRLTMEELLRENRRVEPELSGLKL